jgi:hypothetical protein
MPPPDKLPPERLPVVNAVREATIVPGPLETDRWIYRIVVITLGLAVLGALGGAIALTAYTKEIPEVLVALGSAAVGALAGLLAPPPSARR